MSSRQSPIANVRPCVSSFRGSRIFAPRIKALSDGKSVIGLVMLFGSSVFAGAQAPTPARRPDPLMQLMLTQPSIDISTNVEVRALFDPPVIGLGEKATYRVTINAVSDSIKWPEDIYAPMELTLKQTARGQIFQPALDKLRPTTTINHQVARIGRAHSRFRHSGSKSMGAISWSQRRNWKCCPKPNPRPHGRRGSSWNDGDERVLRAADRRPGDHAGAGRHCDSSV